MIFFTFHSDMKPGDTKSQGTTQKNKMIQRHDKISYPTFIF